MTNIVPLDAALAPELLALINVHLSAAAPGWAMTAGFLAQTLQRHPGEYIIDRWVAERHTLCALASGRVVAGTHLLRYETD